MKTHFKIAQKSTWSPTMSQYRHILLIADPARETSPALVRAVRERRVITFTYAGHARVVEPHAYGVAATGETILHGVQTDGGSVSGRRRWHSR